MGHSAKIVLVILFILVGNVGHEHFLKTQEIDTNTVKIEQYTDFWLWPGNAIPSHVPYINHLYILQGEFLSINKKTMIRLTGTLPAPIKANNVWLVFRIEQANWSETIATSVEQRIMNWEAQGNKVAGIQIDFDAKSAALADYGRFLRQVRARLPSQYKLSVTGLLDWSNSAYLNGLADINHSVDEIIYQTYQDKSTIAHYQEYLEALSKQKKSFKIGLIENGLWQQRLPQVQAIIRNENFRGFVIFINNRNRMLNNS